MENWDKGREGEMRAMGQGEQEAWGTGHHSDKTGGLLSATPFMGDKGVGCKKMGEDPFGLQFLPQVKQKHLRKANKGPGSPNREMSMS